MLITIEGVFFYIKTRTKNGYMQGSLLEVSSNGVYSELDYFVIFVPEISSVYITVEDCI